MARRIGVDFDATYADSLLGSLLRNDGQRNDGKLENALLNEFFGGYPLSKLRLLLTSGNHHAVESGIWIASELGSKARPLFEDISSAIHHPSKKVRFFALDCLLTCAQPEDTQALRRSLDLINDPESAVRWNMLMFLAKAPRTLLYAAVRAAQEDKTAPSHIRGLELLLTTDTETEIAKILDSLTNGDVMLRRYAAAAAGRVAQRDLTPLKEAIKSDDETIKTFAADMLEDVAQSVS